MGKWTRGAALGMALLALGGCGIFRGGEKSRTPVVGERVPILVAENELKADPSIAEVSVLLPAPQANEAWSQPGGNAAKSMGHLALGSTLRQAWSTTIRGGTTRVRLGAAPVVAGGRLYVMDTEGVVHAMAADTGARVWETATGKGEENERSFFGGGVSFDNGRVFASNGVGDVVAMDAATGSEVWRAKPGGPLRGAPTIANGNVFVQSQDNQLFALNQETGKVAWTQSATLETQGVFGVAAPAVAQGTVIAGFSSGELNAYRYENGRTLWQDTLSRTSISTTVGSLSDIDAEPVVDGGRVFAVGQGGRMVALELLTGQRLWEQNLGGIATPWIAGEWLFVVTDEAKLICIARGSGRIRWISQLRRYRDEKDRKGLINWVGPVLAGGRLIVLNSRGGIVSASPETGEIGATVDGGKIFTLPPVVAASILYTLDDAGRLTAWR